MAKNYLLSFFSLSKKIHIIYIHWSLLFPWLLDSLKLLFSDIRKMGENKFLSQEESALSHVVARVSQQLSHTFHIFIVIVQRMSSLAESTTSSEHERSWNVSLMCFCLLVCCYFISFFVSSSSLLCTKCELFLAIHFIIVLNSRPSNNNNKQHTHMKTMRLQDKD